MRARIDRYVGSPAMLTLAGRGIQYASQLAMVLLVPKALIPEAYLELNLVLPLAYLGVSLVFGWLTSSIQRHVYDLLDPRDDSVRQTVFIYYGGVSVVALAVFLAGAAVSDSLYRLIPLLLIAAGLKNAIIGVLNMGGNHRGFFLLNIGFALSLAIFVGFCFYFKGENLDRYLTLYAMSDIVVACIAWYAIGVIRLNHRPQFNRLIAGRYLRYGLPLVVNVIAIWVISLSDRYILSIWEPAETVAAYILSYQLAGSVITIPMTFAIAVILPKILLLDKDQGELAALEYTYRILRIYLKGVGFIFIGACAVVLPFKYYLYSAYEFDPQVMIVIVLAHIIFGFSHFYNKEFELNGRTMVITKAVLLGAFANVTLNFILIPIQGSLGAALSTLIAYGISVFIIFRSRQYKSTVR